MRVGLRADAQPGAGGLGEALEGLGLGVAAVEAGDRALPAPCGPWPPAPPVIPAWWERLRAFVDRRPPKGLR